MNKSNILFLFMAVLLTLTILPMGVSALTYDSVKNNGTWLQYTSGLDSDYYAIDLYKSTYNRGFETSHDWNFPECANGFCTTFSTNYGHEVHSLSTDSEYSQSGNNSLKIVNHTDSPTTFTSGNMHIWGSNEYVGDSNVSFYYNNTDIYDPWHFSYIEYGYETDSNTFVSMGFLVDNITSWTYVSFLVPKGNFRVAFWSHATVSGDQPSTFHADALIDDIDVTKNNAGTFYKGTTAPSCSSIASCSNISSVNDLNYNNERNMYWVTDYVSNASCSWAINGVNQGSLTEMTGGMYYGQITDVPTSGSPLDVNLSASCSKVSYDSKGFYVNPTFYVDSNIQTTMDYGNNATNNYALRGNVITFYSKYKDDLGGTITDGTCNLIISGSSNVMSYNSSTGRNEYSYGFISDGDYTIDHNCSKETYQTRFNSYTFSVGTSATSGLDAEPIQNISSISLSDTNNAITLNSVSNTGNLIFRARTGESSYTFTTFFSNNDRSGKQYFVYTSSDGINWTFNDSLTFGATNSTPIQKIWNDGSNNFDYSFSNTLSQDVWVYYKLVYSEIPKFWGAIGGSVDWINVNPSQVVSESSGKHFYDLFQNSSPTKINSYTREQYPDLTSADLTTGFYLQFNAYAETPIELKVGYKVGSSVATETVYLTTGWNRYSVLIDPNDNEAHLLIKSDSTTSARVYISDYALIPASYFAQRLEIGGSGVLVRGGVSYQTLTELAPFNVQTSFYDREENLSKIYYQIILDGNIIKTYEYNLNQDSLDTSKITYINKELSEVIDYSGNGSINSPLKDITIKAILVNSSDQNVSEQFKTLKFLQFPYYPTDIELSLVSLNNKVGTSPKIQFLINTLNPKAIIGLELKIYDVNHSVADPNYSETIYSDEIGCSNYIYCAKNILVDEWAWAQATTYTVRLTTLVNTEATTYINNLTSKFISVSATSGTLETARVLQVYERRTEANKSYYTQVEPIPLVFQARDDLLRNLQDDILPYIQIDYYADHVTKDAQDIKFYPIKHYYDDATGYNYWFWNRYFYLDNGSLFDTNSQIDFKVTIEVSNATISNENNYSLGNKCLTYPTKYSPSTFLMDWGGRSLLDDFDCVANTPSPIVLYEGASHRIDINSSYIPKSDQSQNVLCVRANEPFNPINDFGDDFACAVLITKSEEQIDTIKVTIGNDASDVGITSEAKQYLNFEFSIDDLLFNDVWATATTLTAPSSVESVGNIGDLLYLGFSEIIPSAMEGYDDFTDWFSYASFQKNTAFDTNFFKNIHYLSSVAFFKVRGLKVINQYDYLNYDSDVRTIPPSKFLAYAQSKNLYVPIKKSQIEIYGSNLEPIRTEIINSPLVISLRPSQTGYKEDANGIRIVAQDIQNIKIEITSDMTSANQTKTNRIYLPMVFGYAVPFNPSWFDVMAGVGDAIQNPIPVFTKFFTNYWFSIVLFLAFALIVSLIYANLRSRNGGTTIINSIPFSRGDSL